LKYILILCSALLFSALLFSALLCSALLSPRIDVGGDIGPFQLAIGLTIVALVLIVAWDENYGDAHETIGVTAAGSGKGPFSLLSSVTGTLSLIAKYPAVLCLGLSQAFFEGGVYTFGEDNKWGLM
jgi:hypothetical protein